MSRSNYSDDSENLGLWRANVERTIASKRGQAFIRDMAAALDAMPLKILIAHDFIDEMGCACAMGVVAQARDLDVKDLDPTEPTDVAGLLGISSMLAQEIAYQNDEVVYRESPEQRWHRMREWARENTWPTESEGADK